MLSMCYENVCTGMKELTFNENALMLVEAATAGVIQKSCT